MIKTTIYTISIFLALTLAATARPLLGEIYGVYPEGVMVDYGNGAYLVPTEHATFQVGGIQATWSKLLPGQRVEVQVPDSYWPSLYQVNDPYAWKMKNHPAHPHGGPPGQMKKYNNNKNNSKGNGKSKNK